MINGLFSMSQRRPAFLQISERESFVRDHEPVTCRWFDSRSVCCGLVND